MANRILKGLAVVAGTGLAMGFSTGRARIRPVPRHSLDPAAPPSRAADPVSAVAVPSGDEFLIIEPLLDRLECLEARIDSLEQPAKTVPLPEDLGHSPSQADWAAYSASLADLERRMDENSRELALLRERMDEVERRAAESADSLRRSVEETRREIPALVERNVAAGFDNLQTRFSEEIDKSHRRTLESFERAIDDRISSRIGSIERALAGQAGAIEVLSLRATETDNNLQRLVSAIEKLCERAQLTASPRDLPPFESQLSDAMRREPVVPVLRTAEPAHEMETTVTAATVPAPAFASPAPKKSRFLFRNLIVAGLGLLASRLLR